MLKRLEEIWKIENIEDFIIAMNDHIGEKCQYGDKISVLNEYERVFFVTQQLEMEVNNGGFSQFFYNSSGDFSHELVHAFTEIGANKTAAICKKALGAFPQTFPVNRYERQEMLDEIESDEIEEIFDECDDEFYEYEDDLTTLNYEYIRKNKQFFM